MTTEYNMTDRLPKDSELQKFGALIDDQSAVLDFAMKRGIGVESLGSTSKNIAHAAVGSHTIGSAISHKVGGLALGAYTEAPSAIGTDNAQALRVDSQGALYVRPASGFMSFSAASTQTHLAGSLLLHGYHVLMSDVNAGDALVIQDGNDVKFPLIATAASQVFNADFSVGIYFSAGIKHIGTYSGAGAASVTLIYSQY